MARSTIIRALNNTGSTLAAGTVVYITGYNETNQMPTIAPADYRYDSRIPAVGVVREDIENGDYDVVKVNGPVMFFDTSGTSINDNVYVGTNGGITFVKPSDIDDDYYTQQIGTVRRVADYPYGELQLFPLEVNKKIRHPELAEVYEDQHHVKLHAAQHRPHSIDPFIHARQHEINGGDTINHNRLENLTTGDVHTQYSLVDGTRDYTGIVSYDSAKTFTSDLEIVNKAYVDLHILQDGSEDFTGIVSYDSAKSFSSDRDIVDKGYVDLHVLVDGTRAFTGVVSGITPTLNAHLATKGYVDSQIPGSSWRDPVIDKDRSSPPSLPDSGDRYIVNPPGVGAWSGHDNEITEWNGSSWDFVSPSEGYSVYANDEDAVYVWNGSAWFSISGSSTVFGSGAAGQVTFWNGTSTVTGESDFYWNSTSNQLGIGTNNPQNTLDVEGAVAIGASYSGTSTAPTNGLIVQGNVGVGQTSATEKLEINGAIKIGASVGTANGTIRWTGSDFEGRRSGAWVSLTNAGMSAHTLGGAYHTADTLANLNSKINDATLIDTGDSRLSNDRTASGLRTATTVVSISSATAPTTGQVLKATSSTNATWQNESGGGGISSGISGSIQFSDGAGGFSSDGSNLFWDDSGNRFSLGHANPTDITILDVESVVDEAKSRAVAKFGQYNAVYIMYSNAHVGFNSYYGGESVANWRYGKGSSSQYGARIGIDAANGYLDFLVSSSSGNEDAIIASSSIFRLRYTGEIWVQELSSGATPNSGYGAIYAKTDGKLYFKSDGGTEYDLTDLGTAGVSEETFNENKLFWNEAVETILKDLDGYSSSTHTHPEYASDQTVSEHYTQHNDAIQTVIKELDGYSTDIGLSTTVQEHYTQHSEAIQTVIKELDGYSSDTGLASTVQEHYTQHSDAIQTIIKELDGYSSDITGLATTVQEHYNQHSDAIQTVIKDLDGYDLGQTVQEHYNQHSEAIQTILKDLDGYGSVTGDITGSGQDGYVTYWTGEKTVSGSEDLVFDEVDGYLGVGIYPNERVTVDGAISMYKVPEPEAEMEYGKIYINQTNGRLYLKLENGENIDLTAFDIDGGSFTDTFENTNNFDAGTW